MSNLFNLSSYLPMNNSSSNKYKPVGNARKTSWNEDLEYVIKTSPSTSHSELPTSHTEVTERNPHYIPESSLRVAEEGAYKTINNYARLF